MTAVFDGMHLSPLGWFGWMRMSQIAADSTAELLEMADRIGLDRRHLQHPGNWRGHFDIEERGLRMAEAVFRGDFSPSAFLRHLNIDLEGAEIDPFSP